MARKKGKRDFTQSERMEIATAICEAYKLGHGIVDCCKANGIPFKTFYQWLPKYAEINELYKSTLIVTKTNENDILRSVARYAVLENLSGNSKEIKTVTVKENVKVVTRGKVEYVPIEKTIIEVIQKAPSMTAAKLALEKLDPVFKKDAEDLPNPELQDNEFIANRNKFLEEKIKELEERMKNK